MKGKATSFDIAYRAGVSQATVSRALSGSHLVSEETRKRIQAIADELHYKVDKNASALRRQHSATLALLLFEDPTVDDSLINPFFLSMVGQITRTSAKLGYDLLISFQQLSDDWHADFQDSHKADGLILLGYGNYLDAKERLLKLTQQGTHFVRWGAVESGQPGTSIGCDNISGGEIATAHLLSQGRKRIVFLGDNSDGAPEFRDRYLGYQRALEKANIPQESVVHAKAVDSTETLGFEAICLLLASGATFDAIFAASDLLAIGAMKALSEQGLKVPTDVAIVGFDDVQAARFTNPPLTTVLQDTKLAGQMLVETLVRKIRKDKSAEIDPGVSQMLPAKLVVRRSCGAAES
jgi:DNA-binding LacI/PurR family transcriptional regulator